MLSPVSLSEATVLQSDWEELKFGLGGIRFLCEAASIGLGGIEIWSTPITPAGTPSFNRTGRN